MLPLKFGKHITEPHIGKHLLRNLYRYFLSLLVSIVTIPIVVKHIEGTNVMALVTPLVENHSLDGRCNTFIRLFFDQYNRHGLKHEFILLKKVIDAIHNLFRVRKRTKFWCNTIVGNMG